MLSSLCVPILLLLYNIIHTVVINALTVTWTWNVICVYIHERTRISTSHTVYPLNEVYDHNGLLYLIFFFLLMWYMCIILLYYTHSRSFRFTSAHALSTNKTRDSDTPRHVTCIISTSPGSSPLGISYII